MSKITEKTVEIDTDGGAVSLALEATWASRGGWKIFRLDAETGEEEVLGKGKAEGTTVFELDDPPASLIGDILDVRIVAANLKSEASFVGADVKVRQGGEVIVEMDDKANVEGLQQFDFVLTFEEA